MPKDLAKLVAEKFEADDASVIMEKYSLYFCGFGGLTHTQFLHNCAQVLTWEGC